MNKCYKTGKKLNNVEKRKIDYRMFVADVMERHI